MKTNKRRLEEKLRRYKINFESWKPGELEKLVKEINQGKAKLIIRKGQLYKSVTMIVVDVQREIYQNFRLRLIESETVTRNNRHLHVRPTVGLSVKKHHHESDLASAIWAIKHKLKFKGKPEVRKSGLLENEWGVSGRHPSLTIEVTYLLFTWDMPKEHFKYEYVWKSGEHNVKFHWTPVSASSLQGRRS